MTFGLRTKTTIFLVLTIILGTASLIVWATIPINFSGVDIQPVIRVMDKNGTIRTLTSDSLLTTRIQYPDVAKIMIGAQATIQLIDMEDTKIEYWIEYRINVKSSSSGKSGDFRGWFSGTPGSSPEYEWENDRSWTTQSKTWFTRLTLETLSFMSKQT